MLNKNKKYLIDEPINTQSDRKQPDNCGEILPGKSMIRKLFDGEMLIGTLATTLLQIFCKIILNFLVIVKSILDPDDNSCKNS